MSHRYENAPILERLISTGGSRLRPLYTDAALTDAYSQSSRSNVITTTWQGFYLMFSVDYYTNTMVTIINSQGNRKPGAIVANEAQQFTGQGKTCR